MSQPTRGPHAARGPQLTRGPLPAAIYWRRRVVALVAVLGVVALVVVPVRLVTGGGDDPADQGGEVTLAGGSATTGPTVSATAATASTSPTKQKKQKQKKAAAPALPEPQGSCAPEDVVVRPTVADAVAGRPVTVELKLRTRLAEACTWELSRASFTWKLTSGSDEIWTSRECPRAVPSRELVVRRDTVATTELTWGGRRSDADCSRLTDWALPGWYHVTVAALAGEPRSSEFELRARTPATITASPEPQGKKNGATQAEEKAEKKKSEKKKRG